MEEVESSTCHRNSIYREQPPPLELRQSIQGRNKLQRVSALPGLRSKTWTSGGHGRDIQWAALGRTWYVGHHPLRCWWNLLGSLHGECLSSLLIIAENLPSGDTPVECTGKPPYWGWQNSLSSRSATETQWKAPYTGATEIRQRGALLDIPTHATGSHTVGPRTKAHWKEEVSSSLQYHPQVLYWQNSILCPLAREKCLKGPSPQ